MKFNPVLIHTLLSSIGSEAFYLSSMYHIHALGVFFCLLSFAIFRTFVFTPLWTHTGYAQWQFTKQKWNEMKPEKGVELLECLRSFQRLHEGPWQSVTCLMEIPQQWTRRPPCDLYNQWFVLFRELKIKTTTKSAKFLKINRGPFFLLHTRPVRMCLKVVGIWIFV